MAARPRAQDSPAPWGLGGRLIPVAAGGHRLPARLWRRGLPLLLVVWGLLAWPGSLAALQLPDRSGAETPVPLAAGPERVSFAEDGASLQAGAALFEAHCAGCHGGGGNVIRRGRTLRLEALQRAQLADPEAIARVAAAGVGQMSGYGAVLGEEGSRRVAGWVWLQARAGWPRPPRMTPLP